MAEREAILSKITFPEGSRANSPCPRPTVAVTLVRGPGRIDYDRLRELFGTQEVTPEVLAPLHHLTGGELHPLLTRGIYYLHRDFGPVLDGFANGRPFFLYSGRGPLGAAAHVPSRSVRPVPVVPASSRRTDVHPDHRRREGPGVVGVATGGDRALGT